MDLITASITTMPSRITSFRKVISDILPQVDRIHIFFNRFQKYPDFEILKNSKITSHLDNNLHERSRIFPLSTTDGYFFILDDDINYPPDYVIIMITAIEKYNRTSLITVHGSTLSSECVQSPDNYKRWDFSRTVIDLTHALYTDTRVDVAGAPTTAFHTCTMRSYIEDFPVPHAFDLSLSYISHKKMVPIISIKRPENWLTKIATSGYSIGDEVLNNPEIREHRLHLMQSIYSLKTSI